MACTYNKVSCAVLNTVKTDWEETRGDTCALVTRTLQASCMLGQEFPHDPVASKAEMADKKGDGEPADEGRTMGQQGKKDGETAV